MRVKYPASVTQEHCLAQALQACLDPYFGPKPVLCYNNDVRASVCTKGVEAFAVPHGYWQSLIDVLGNMTGERTGTKRVETVINTLTCGFRLPYIYTDHHAVADVAS